MAVTFQKIEDTYLKIKDSIRRTPLFKSNLFQKHLKVEHPVYFKVESLQYTGSFKGRGALAKILSILDSARKVGVVTASAGNHAQGVSYYCQKLQIHAKIVMPVGSPLVKINYTRRYGAEVILFGESYQESYQKALEIQKQEGREFIHAFDDDEVIAGQGSIGLEILEDCPDVSVVVAPVGGGGLIGGIGTVLKNKKPNAKIIGVQATGCSTLLPSLQAGHPVTLAKVNTIAEGMAVKRMGEKTFELCKKLVDKVVLSSDEEIAEGILWLLENERLFVEGCGGAAWAALAKDPSLVTGPTVVILSGGNLDVRMLSRIIERGMAKTGRLIQFEARIPDIPGSLQKLAAVLAEQQANVMQVHHEHVFGEMGIREVSTRVIAETHGWDHTDRLKSALNKQGWTLNFSE